MTSTQTKTLTIFAPAKINLYLHVTGRLDNGYHTLDSMVGFADIGDEIRIEPATLDFAFNVQGPYANAFSPKEIDASPNSSNLAVQAAWAISRAAQKIPDVKITLTKNLPLASGLGGGSADAAAIIWGLLEWWGVSRQSSYLPSLLATLGADVPACLNCEASRLRGIGDIIDPVPPMPEIPIVLVNPGKSCPTGQVFSRYNGQFREPEKLPETLGTLEELTDFIGPKNNDLYGPACKVVPEIENVLRAIDAQAGCRLARMVGAGATCFGLFETEKQAGDAAKNLGEENPDWWARAGMLNRPERY
ncbi:MAG: 4-diphosphocytidyl-2-C-methyl-D-erythritol kinase [Micavibrio sp.]|nr:MAG: 4-diphosphocytidyl-2-C-methyl-D-erythritol kinase [Micavibrio sp.]